jgi:hypothetical protein
MAATGRSQALSRCAACCARLRRAPLWLCPADTVRTGGELEVYFDDTQPEVTGQAIEGAALNYRKPPSLVRLRPAPLPRRHPRRLILRTRLRALLRTRETHRHSAVADPRRARGEVRPHHRLRFSDVGPTTALSGSSVAPFCAHLATRALARQIRRRSQALRLRPAVTLDAPATSATSPTISPRPSRARGDAAPRAPRRPLNYRSSPPAAKFYFPLKMRRPG